MQKENLYFIIFVHVFYNWDWSLIFFYHVYTH